MLTCNLSYQLVLQEGWEIEGLDLATAFLQTLPTEESKQLWTSGVKELRDALNLPEHGAMRILKDFYGSQTAPRNLGATSTIPCSSLELFETSEMVAFGFGEYLPILPKFHNMTTKMMQLFAGKLWDSWQVTWMIFTEQVMFLMSVGSKYVLPSTPCASGTS